MNVIINFINIYILNNNSILYFIIYYLTYLDVNMFIVTLFLTLFLSKKIIYKVLIVWLLYFISITIYSNNLSVCFWINELTYGFNTTHPILFYISLILIFINIKNFYIIKNYKIVNLLLTVITLLLGMYWGSINPGWGFFWSNDQIEYILFFFFIINYFFFTQFI